jgi:hypothetical protein
MLTDPQREHIKMAARTMQIIAGALAAGVVIFLAIVLFLTSQRAVGPAGDSFLTYIAAAYSLAAIMAWAIVPSVIGGRMRQSIVDRNASQWTMKLANAAELGDALPLTSVYQTRLIVGCALLEGAAFFCLVAYLLEQQPMGLIIAGVLLLLLLSQVPTVPRLESWVEGELATIDQLRLMRRT